MDHKGQVAARRGAVERDTKPEASLLITRGRSAARKAKPREGIVAKRGAAHGMAKVALDIERPPVRRTRRQGEKHGEQAKPKPAAPCFHKVAHHSHRRHIASKCCEFLDRKSTRLNSSH